MISRAALFLILVISSLAANAGQEGHGGEVIVCPGKPTVVYDTYEARLRGIGLDLGPIGISSLAKVKLALGRFAKQDYYNADVLLTFANMFDAETMFNDFSLLPVLDGNQAALPENCELKQLVDQRPPLFAEDKRYYIDNKYWSQLDNDQKAVAILHEIIYRRAIEFEQADSVGTRYLNSYIFSGKIAAASNEDYYRVMTEAGFFRPESTISNFITLQGVTFTNRDLNSRGSDDRLETPIEFYPNGKVKKGYLAAGTPVKIAGQNLPGFGETEFFDNGSLKTTEVISDSETPFNLNGHTLFLDSHNHRYPKVLFSSDGHLLECWLSWKTLTSYPVLGQNVAVVAQAGFYASGALKFACILGSYEFKTQDGGYLIVDNSTNRCLDVKFDEQGFSTEPGGTVMTKDYPGLNYNIWGI